MDELKVEVAIEILERKISEFIKNNKETNFEKFKKELQQLIEEREKIYELDEETIERVYTECLKKNKGDKENG